MIPYEELEKHFTAPKNTVSNTRVPRKFKKKWEHILCGSRYNFLDLIQKLWYTQYLNNPDYTRFLIKQICKVVI